MFVEGFEDNLRMDGSDFLTPCTCILSVCKLIFERVSPEVAKGVIQKQGYNLGKVC